MPSRLPVDLPQQPEQLTGDDLNRSRSNHDSNPTCRPRNVARYSPESSAAQVGREATGGYVAVYLVVLGVAWFAAVVRSTSRTQGVIVQVPARGLLVPVPWAACRMEYPGHRAVSLVDVAGVQFWRRR
jgi:hypothetical protein